MYLISQIGVLSALSCRIRQVTGRHTAEKYAHNPDPSPILALSPSLVRQLCRLTGSIPLATHHSPNTELISAPPDTMTSTQLASSTAYPECPAANMSTQTSASGMQYRIYCDMDDGLTAYSTLNLPGGSNVPDYAQCFSACDADTTCLSLSAYGSCYLKHSIGDLAASIGPTYGQRLDGPAAQSVATSASYPPCPAASNTVQLSSNGTQFRILCDSDSNAASYYSVRLSSDTDYSQCLSTCSADTACVSFTFFNYFCYLKSSLSGPFASRGISLAEKLGLDPSRPATSTSSASSTASTTSSCDAAASSCAGAAQTSSSSTSHHALSTGAIVGLVIGVTIFVVLAIGLCLWRRRRAQRSQIEDARRELTTSTIMHRERAAGSTSSVEQHALKSTSPPQSQTQYTDSLVNSPDTREHKEPAVELSDDQRIHELHADSKLRPTV
ncbi:hypothetical protein ANO11243_094350 [Dothideomycetidae sp. 11243]|nr:hypothetical protein ANO11243_094350 [fungal sp. No.11243]